MDSKNELIPELELCITPTQNGELRIELMDEGFIAFLEKQKILITDIFFIPQREVQNCFKRLRKAYEEYKKEQG